MLSFDISFNALFSYLLPYQIPLPDNRLLTEFATEYQNKIINDWTRPTAVPIPELRLLQAHTIGKGTYHIRHFHYRTVLHYEGLLETDACQTAYCQNQHNCNGFFNTGNGDRGHHPES